MAAALQGLKAEVEERKTGYHIVPAAAAHSILMLGGRVEGGTNFNVVPDACRFTVERRFNPEEDLETEKARLFALFEQVRQQGIRTRNRRPARRTVLRRRGGSSGRARPGGNSRSRHRQASGL